MGLKDWFSSAGRDKSRLARSIKTTTSEFANTADRYAAMQDLLNLAKKEPEYAQDAYVGLLRRFGMTSSKTIEDEEEKGWLYRQLLAIGSSVVPAVTRYCVEHENIAWALRILEELSSEEQEWDCLNQLVAAHPPETFDRTPHKKQQLISHLQELDDPRVVEMLSRYLNDPDETIRFQSCECLLDIADLSTMDALVARLCNPEEDSLRLRNRILTGFSKLGWEINSYKDQIVPFLGTDYLIANNKVLRR